MSFMEENLQVTWYMPKGNFNYWVSLRAISNHEFDENIQNPRCVLCDNNYTHSYRAHPGLTSKQLQTDGPYEKEAELFIFYEGSNLRC